MTDTRIDRRMAKLKAEGRPALVTYFMGGDPDYATSLKVMKALPNAGSDIIELGILATEFGRTSMTMRAVVRNMITRRRILSIERIVYVSLGPDGKPAPHGYSTITYERDRMPHEGPAQPAD